MLKFRVIYIKNGKSYKEVVEIPDNNNADTKRAFNEFFRKIKKRGLNKKNVKVSDIYKIE